MTFSLCARSVRLACIGLAMGLSLWLTGCATTGQNPDASAQPVAVTAPTQASPSQRDLAVNFKAQGNLGLQPPTDIWERIRRGFAMPDLDTDLVRDREQWYAARPDYLLRMTERSRRYIYHIVEELERRNMPTELALLPFIESAFNPEAVSSAKAAGMWQFMPATGKYFDLKQNMFRDERRDVLESTSLADLVSGELPENVRSLADAERMLRETGCAGIAIGVKHALLLEIGMSFDIAIWIIIALIFISRLHQSFGTLRVSHLTHLKED